MIQGNGSLPWQETGRECGICAGGVMGSQMLPVAAGLQPLGRCQARRQSGLQVRLRVGRNAPQGRAWPAQARCERDSAPECESAHPCGGPILPAGPFYASPLPQHRA